MAWAEIDVGPIPPEVRSIVVDYRIVGSSSYVRLGETQARVSRWQVPQEPPILLRARFRDERGRIGPGIETGFEATQAVSDRPAMADLDVPDAVVKQTDGPVIEITQDVPDGSDPKEFVVEVAQALSGDTHPKDGIHLGYVEPGEKLEAHAWQASYKVWTRLVRLSDGRASDWADTIPFTQILGEVQPTLGHSNDFASGTIGTVGGMTTAEISGGDLRSKAMYAGDLSAYAGDCSLDAGAMGLYWPLKYTTASVTIAQAESLMFQFEPDLTSTTRPTYYAGDWNWPAGGPPRFEPDGTPNADARMVRDGFMAGGHDELPMTITASIKPNGAGPYPFLPGQVWDGQTNYTAIFEIRPWFNRRITIDNLYVWHWVWCRSRPWHTHSSGFELVYEAVLTAAAVSHDATLTSGNDWDELYVQVLWKNAVAATVVLYVRPNNDSTANNYVDSGGVDANNAFTMGAGIAQNEYQRCGVRLVIPASGSVREAIVDDAASWTTTTATAPAGGDAYIWKDTTDITSFRILTDNGGSALGIGTAIRVWGKRYHEA